MKNQHVVVTKLTCPYPKVYIRQTRRSPHSYTIDIQQTSQKKRWFKLCTSFIGLKPPFQYELDVLPIEPTGAKLTKLNPLKWMNNLALFAQWPKGSHHCLNSFS